jgi:hypothetical protein
MAAACVFFGGGGGRTHARQRMSGKLGRACMWRAQRSRCLRRRPRQQAHKLGHTQPASATPTPSSCGSQASEKLAGTVPGADHVPLWLAPGRAQPLPQLPPATPHSQPAHTSSPRTCLGGRLISRDSCARDHADSCRCVTAARRGGQQRGRHTRNDQWVQQIINTAASPLRHQARCITVSC